MLKYSGVAGLSIPAFWVFKYIKPIARLIGQLRRVIILLPNISVRQNSPSSGAVKAK